MIKDKVAIVTGGTRGIGYEIVRKFLQNNAKVILLGSREETVNKALEKLKSENQNYEVIGLYPNLSDEQSIKECFKNIHSMYGRIDILVNNAGISSNTKIEEFSIEEYEKVENVNIKSVFICSKAIIPYLKETKGRSDRVDKKDIN